MSFVQDPEVRKGLKERLDVQKHIEKPTDYRSLFKDTSNVTSMAKTQKDLIKEIAMLEVEIIYLERLLLTKYRKAFDNIDIDDQQVLSSFHQTEVNEKIKILGSKGENLQTYNFKDSSLLRSVNNIKKHSRCLSSLSQQSLCSDRISALKENSTNSTRFYHLEPLHPEKHDQNSTPNIISLAEHFGTSITDHVPQTPNRLSEDIIRCLSGIYFKLGTVSVMHHGSPSSSTSSLSSMSELSSQHVDTWSPNCKKEPSVDIKSENHFQYEELNELKGSYSLMIQVSQICRDDQKMSEVGYMMKSLRSLVRCLEKIDLRKMNNQDKLAFWINIHNALIMHAYLRYGIPKSNMKRSFLLSKAAYNVGGHIIHADTIQNSILGCHISLPGKWIKSLFYPKMKFKDGDERRAYAISNAEPLVQFALCSGRCSDPVLRIYTSKKVFQELEIAKNEYLQSTIRVYNEQKIFLPKLMESFAKDTGMTPSDVLNLIKCYLPQTLQKSISTSQPGKLAKNLEWLPHNFSFRYLFPKELMKM